MKSLSDIRRQITPALHQVEACREERIKTIAKEREWHTLTVLIIILGFIILSFGQVYITILCITAGMMGSILISVFKVGPHYLAYIQNFKKEVFTAFIQELYPNTYYAPSNYLPNILYTNAQLFGEYDSYQGKDYFQGQIDNGCRFQFSELKVDKINDIALETRKTTVFSGFFFVLDVKHREEGRVQILPASVENRLRFSEDFFQKYLGDFFLRPDIVDLKAYPEFKKAFIVYGKDEADVYRILTPALLKIIYHLQYVWKISLSISFIDQQVHIALPTQKNFFHPNIERSVLDNELLRELYDILGLGLAGLENLSEEHKPSDIWEELNSLNSKNGGIVSNPFLL